MLWFVLALNIVMIVYYFWDQTTFERAIGARLRYLEGHEQRQERIIMDLRKRVEDVKSELDNKIIQLRIDKQDK